MITKIKSITYNLLKKSEKYFKTDMVYLARGGFWLTFGQLTTSAMAFLLSIAFAHWLSQETFGLYKYILSIVGMLSIFNLSGINTALTRAVSQGKEGSYFPALKTKIKWGLIGSFISATLSAYYFITGNNTLAIGCAIVAIFSPISDNFSLYSSYLHGKQLFKESSIYTTITQITAIAFLIATIFFTQNLFIILSVYFITNFSLQFAFHHLSLKRFPANQEIDNATIPYGKHLSLINALVTIAQHFDKILIFHFLGPVNLAIYVFATVFPEYLKNFLKFIQSILLPKYAKMDKGQILQSLSSKTPKMLAILITLIVTYILFSPFLFNYIFPQYTESLIYSQIFSISLIYFVIALPISALQAQGDQKKLYQFYITTSVFQIVSLLAIVPFFGIMGAVVARVIARLIQPLFIFYLIKYVKH